MARALSLSSSCTSAPRRSFLSSSLSVSEPEPSGSQLSKRASISFLGTSSPSIGIALRNSFLSTAPDPSSSHSRNRSITRTACSLRAFRSCSP